MNNRKTNLTVRGAVRGAGYWAVSEAVSEAVCLAVDGAVDGAVTEVVVEAVVEAVTNLTFAAVSQSLKDSDLSALQTFLQEDSNKDGNQSA